MIAGETRIIERYIGFWENKLSGEELRILRGGGSERPFLNEYYYNRRSGLYLCRGCGRFLFSSEHKYNSGSGWPSFYDILNEDAINLTVDHSLGQEMTEVLCGLCGSHLGHLFEDGPAPTGLRYSLNSASLKFCSIFYLQADDLCELEARVGKYASVRRALPGMARLNGEKNGEEREESEEEALEVVVYYDQLEDEGLDLWKDDSIREAACGVNIEFTPFPLEEQKRFLRSKERLFSLAGEIYGGEKILLESDIALWLNSCAADRLDGDTARERIMQNIYYPLRKKKMRRLFKLL